MKAIVLKEPGHFCLSEIADVDEIPAGMALVKVRTVGICGTDIHAYHGRQPFFTYPRILGHELGVEVVACSVCDSSLKPGDRCAVEPYLSCGKCNTCRRGHTNCCEQLKVLGVHIDGGMRDMLLVPCEKLFRSERLDFDQLALVEMLAIGFHAVDRASIASDENILVIGAGPIGLTVVESAREASAHIWVVDKSPARLAFCKDIPGVEDVISSDTLSPEGLRERLDGDLPTAVFDATGNGQSMMSAFDYVAYGGRLIYVGFFQGDVKFHDPHFHSREISLLASRNATAREFAQLIDAIEGREINAIPWVTHHTTPERLPKEFPDWLSPGSGLVKGLVHWS